MSKADILEQLPRLGSNERQEIFDRLCELQESELHATHQQWVDEALKSGPATPATEADWQGALRRGLARGAKSR